MKSVYLYDGRTETVYTFGVANRIQPAAGFTDQEALEFIKHLDELKSMDPIPPTIPDPYGDSRVVHPVFSHMLLERNFYTGRTTKALACPSRAPPPTGVGAQPGHTIAREPEPFGHGSGQAPCRPNS